jgi:hypothetical protein
MFGVRWMLHQPSHALGDVATPVFNRALVIVIPSHIVESVLIPLPESLIIWHAHHKLLDTIAIFEAGEMQSRAFFLQCVVIVCLHALLLDCTLDIFVLFMQCKRVVGIVLLVRLKDILSVAFTLRSDGISQRSTSTGVCFGLWQRRWLW